MILNELITFLESKAPLHLQESYDNCGLICGDRHQTLSGVLISLDCTEEIIEEAIEKGCNVVVCHHPILFRGIKHIRPDNYVNKTLIRAIKNDVAIYAIHTNLDHCMDGVNSKILEKLGLLNGRILSAKKELLRKLSVYVPHENLEELKTALFQAGAGEIGNYSECSFSQPGTGTFKPNHLANPTTGEKGIRHTGNEEKLEVILPNWLTSNILKAMKAAHPYEEVAYEVVALENELQTTGSGMIGEYAEAISAEKFLQQLKNQFNAKGIRYTKLLNKPIKRVAVCGGSGSFLLQQAINQGTDAFVTGDFKYHEFFDAEGKILIADIGHYESEQFTIELLGEWITKKFNTFAVRFTEKNTNPINYL